MMMADAFAMLFPRALYFQSLGMSVGWRPDGNDQHVIEAANQHVEADNQQFIFIWRSDLLAQIHDLIFILYPILHLHISALLH